jgi:hypothetical protein
MFNNALVKSLRYNELKLQQGKAECLLAENFIKDLDDLKWRDKLFHFHRLTSLNQIALKNAIHITINFHPSDSLSNRDMQDISKRYMQEMKLSRQPYLVYRHFDSAHPHLHIVSTTIRKDGSTLSLSPSDLRRSAKISHAIESSYSLSVSGKGVTEEQRLGQTEKFTHGEQPFMPFLSQVIENVVPTYQYTSIEELNAVLGLYGIEAYRGKISSHLYRHHGLIYRLTDGNGHTNRSQIKASNLESKPTLTNLEKNFTLHRSSRQEHRDRLTIAIEWAFIEHSPDLPDFKRLLEKEKISVVLQKDPGGASQNVFYVDHETKAVFEGATLGDRYTADAIIQRCTQKMLTEQEQELRQTLIIPRQRTETPQQRLNHRYLF